MISWTEDNQLYLIYLYHLHLSPWRGLNSHAWEEMAREMCERKGMEVDGNDCREKIRGIMRQANREGKKKNVEIIMEEIRGVGVENRARGFRRKSSPGLSSPHRSNHTRLSSIEADEIIRSDSINDEFTETERETPGNPWSETMTSEETVEDDDRLSPSSSPATIGAPIPMSIMEEEKHEGAKTSQVLDQFDSEAVLREDTVEFVIPEEQKLETTGRHLDSVVSSGSDFSENMVGRPDELRQLLTCADKIDDFPVIAGNEKQDQSGQLDRECNLELNVKDDGPVNSVNFTSSGKMETQIFIVSDDEDNEDRISPQMPSKQSSQNTVQKDTHPILSDSKNDSRAQIYESPSAKQGLYNTANSPRTPPSKTIEWTKQMDSTLLQHQTSFRSRGELTARSWEIIAEEMSRTFKSNHFTISQCRTRYNILSERGVTGVADKANPPTTTLPAQQFQPLETKKLPAEEKRMSIQWNKNPSCFDYDAFWTPKLDYYFMKHRKESLGEDGINQKVAEKLKYRFSHLEFTSEMIISRANSLRSQFSVLRSIDPNLWSTTLENELYQHCKQLYVRWMNIKGITDHEFCKTYHEEDRDRDDHIELGATSDGNPKGEVPGIDSNDITDQVDSIEDEIKATPLKEVNTSLPLSPQIPQVLRSPEPSQPPMTIEWTEDMKAHLLQIISTSSAIRSPLTANCWKKIAEEMKKMFNSDFFTVPQCQLQYYKLTKIATEDKKMTTEKPSEESKPESKQEPATEVVRTSNKRKDRLVEEDYDEDNAETSPSKRRVVMTYGGDDAETSPSKRKVVMSYDRTWTPELDYNLMKYRQEFVQENGIISKDGYPKISGKFHRHFPDVYMTWHMVKERSQYLRSRSTLRDFGSSFWSIDLENQLFEQCKERYIQWLQSDSR